MKIAFLVDSTVFSGGNFVIFQYATFLKKEKHHEVSIVITSKRKIQRTDKHTWKHKAWDVVSFITLSQAKKKKFDFAIATYWNTVQYLGDIRANRYTYFVQGLESDFYQKKEHRLIKLANDTYLTPLPIITVADWLSKYLQTYYQKKVWVVKNGIDKSIFKVEGKKIQRNNNSDIRVLVEGDIESLIKNISLALELCKKAGVGETWLLTLSPIQSHPLADRVFSQITPLEVAMVYRSCDVLVKLSKTESTSLPCIEMFHCGGTVITSNIYGFTEYIKKDVNGLLVDLDDTEKVVSYLRELKKNKSKLEKLKYEALQTAHYWNSWKKSFVLFNTCLLDINKTYDTLFNNALIKSYTNSLKKEYAITFFDIYTQLKKTVEYKNGQITTKEKQIAIKEEQIAIKEEQIAIKEEQIAIKEEQIQIEKSYTNVFFSYLKKVEAILNLEKYKYKNLHIRFSDMASQLDNITSQLDESKKENTILQKYQKEYNTLFQKTLSFKFLIIQFIRVFVKRIIDKILLILFLYIF